MHLPGWPAWTRLAALAGAVLVLLLACGGDKVSVPACDGGACLDSGGSSGSSSGAFPFSGPTCTGPGYNLACWQCVQRSCPSIESCLTTECGGFFTCYCSCALGSTSCQQSCEGALSMTCQACAQSVTNCQKEACPTVCEPDGG